MDRADHQGSLARWWDDGLPEFVSGVEFLSILHITPLLAHSNRTISTVFFAATMLAFVASLDRGLIEFLKLRLHPGDAPAVPDSIGHGRQIQRLSLYRFCLLVVVFGLQNLASALPWISPDLRLQLPVLAGCWLLCCGVWRFLRDRSNAARWPK